MNNVVDTTKADIVELEKTREHIMRVYDEELFRVQELIERKKNKIFELITTKLPM